MRILYNLRDQSPRAGKSLGILKVSLGLLEGLTSCLEKDDTITVLINRDLREWLPQMPSTVQFEGTETRHPRGWRRFLWDQIGLPRRARRSPTADWLVLPKGFVPFAWRRQRRPRLLAYVHDTLLDDFYKGRRDSPGGRAERIYFTQALRQTLRKASLLATNSHFTADCLRQRDPVGKVVVGGIGFPKDAGNKSPQMASCGERSQQDAKRRGILLPVSPFPHKLSRQAVEWTQRWAAETGFTEKITALGHLSADGALPPESRWLQVSGLSERELSNLLRSHRILVQFSAFEGYGMLPREALLHGARTVASDIPPFRETLPSDFLFLNDDFRDFAKKISRALEVPPLKIQCESWEQVAASIFERMSGDKS
jgi:hypothetical protein